MFMHVNNVHQEISCRISLWNRFGITLLYILGIIREGLHKISSRICGGTDIFTKKHAGSPALALNYNFKVRCWCLWTLWRCPRGGVSDRPPIMNCTDRWFLTRRFYVTKVNLLTLMCLSWGFWNPATQRWAWRLSFFPHKVMGRHELNNLYKIFKYIIKEKWSTEGSKSRKTVANNGSVPHPMFVSAVLHVTSSRVSKFQVMRFQEWLKTHWRPVR